MSNTNTTTARDADNAKVDFQNFIDNNNWQRYANRVMYETNPTAHVYHVPNPERFGVYDVTTTIDNTTIYVELKERWEHYATYMIDVAKIEGLRGLVDEAKQNGNNSTSAILTIMEPLTNSVYTFDLARIDWDATPVETRWVRKSTLRECEGYTDEFTQKPFYFLDWRDSRKHDFTDWMPETMEAIKQKRLTTVK